MRIATDSQDESRQPEPAPPYDGKLAAPRREADAKSWVRLKVLTRPGALCRSCQSCRVAVCSVSAILDRCYDSREPQPVDRRPFGPDHRDPGLSLTSPPSSNAARN